MQDRVIVESRQIARRCLLCHVAGCFRIRRAMHTVEPADQERHRSAAMGQDEFKPREPVHDARRNQGTHGEGCVVGIGNDLVECEAFGAGRRNRLCRVNEYRRAKLDTGSPVFVQRAFAEVFAVDM